MSSEALLIRGVNESRTKILKACVRYIEKYFKAQKVVRLITHHCKTQCVPAHVYNDKINFDLNTIIIMYIGSGAYFLSANY